MHDSLSTFQYHHIFNLSDLIERYFVLLQLFHSLDNWFQKVSMEILALAQYKLHSLQDLLCFPLSSGLTDLHGAVGFFHLNARKMFLGQWLDWGPRNWKLRPEWWQMSFICQLSKIHPIFEKAEFPLKDHTHTLGRMFLDSAECLLNTICQLQTCWDKSGLLAIIYAIKYFPFEIWEKILGWDHSVVILYYFIAALN